MKHEVKKITKIIDEVLTFCVYNYQPQRCEIILETEPDFYKVTQKFYNVEIPEEDLADIEKQLSTRRNHELEDYYWQLTGEQENSKELDLVGMMSDEARIDYKNNTLTIELVRKF